MQSFLEEFIVKKRLILAFLFVFCLLVTIPSVDAVYKAKKEGVEPRPVFANAEEERAYDLRHGEIFTDGGYVKKGAWGKMEGVVQAPPQVVWKLFLQANAWRQYRLPNLKDSRAVSAEVANQSKGFKTVEDLYALIGDRIFSEVEGQRIGGVWVNYTFQYYDLPWPVANKWVVLKNNNDETRSAEGVYRSEWVKVGGNVNTLNGTFTLAPFDGDRNLTHLVYNVESAPASHVPKFFIKWGVKKSLPAAMNIIRREARRLYRPAPLLKTQ